MSNKIHRHTWGLREALFQEWEALRAGKIDARRAQASAALARTIMQSVEVEMAYTDRVNRAKDGDMHPISAHVRLGLP
jgi:hypothetical protein